MFSKQQIDAVYQARKSRLAHPEGSFDNGGRFYPSESENADNYTAGLRSPSRAYPYSYMTGARTLKHVKALSQANPTFFAKLVAEAEQKFAAAERKAA